MLPNSAVRQDTTLGSRDESPQPICATESIAPGSPWTATAAPPRHLSGRKPADHHLVPMQFLDRSNDNAVVGSPEKVRQVVSVYLQFRRWTADSATSCVVASHMRCIAVCYTKGQDAVFFDQLQSRPQRCPGHQT